MDQNKTPAGAAVPALSSATQAGRLMGRSSPREQRSLTRYGDSIKEEGMIVPMTEDNRTFRLRAIACEQRSSSSKNDSVAKQEWTALATLSGIRQRQFGSCVI